MGTVTKGRTLGVNEALATSGCVNPAPAYGSQAAMKIPPPILSRILAAGAVAGTLWLAGCASSPSSRIEKNYSAYESWPEDVRRKVKAGQVDIGFTEKQVVMALGKPDRVFERRTENGDSEVWAYRSKKPRVSIGFGVGVSSGGGYGSHTHTSTAVGISSSDWRDDDATHVIFRDGAVIAIETGTR